MNLIDGAFVIVVATLAGLAAQRRLTGLLVGAGGVLALRPLVVLADLNAYLALVGALLVGFGLALLGRQVLRLSGGTGPMGGVLGGLGGGLLGLALVLSVVTSLPIGRSPLNPNELVYPHAESLPLPVRPAIQRSAVVAFGSEVLFAPLFAEGALPRERAALVGALHRWLVVGEPWTAAP
jgi:hypothetical protein